ncbi:HAMP domain-containing histidine kinase [Paenibacillus sp. IB182496]|uniref:histidine kinase n=1 Tax=Paenibacillus sabuli TaxID=2772509 RepID=A0A927BQB9_9BACL|nr:HAMP domain-containing sensor histidine kinase [Paenibacillus sabuli]MBD2843604.1 HAMP domain-containing histidine kinase [Paenibacillus sabuli]
MKLSLKLWIYFIVSSAAAIVLFVTIALTLGTTLQPGHTYETLKALADEMTMEANRSGGGASALRTVTDAYQSENPSFVFEWLDPEGTIIHASNGRSESYASSELIRLLANKSDSYWDLEHPVNMLYPADIAGRAYYLHLEIPPEAMRESQILLYFRSWTSLFSLTIPFLVFITTPYFFTYRFFHSLRKRLTKIVDALSGMSIDRRREIHDRHNDEIGQLAHHFNAMSKRIREQVTQIQDQENKRKTLISNLSHDLRTPLTNILGYAKTLQRGLYKNDEELQAYTDIILSRSQYMEKLINALFQVSQYDLHGFQIQKAPVQIAVILRKVLAEYVAVLESKEIEADLSIPDISVTLMADANLLERAIRNLIDNAIKYGSDGNYLRVEYKEGKEGISFSVIDRGQGVSAEQQQLLFDRFYQESQNRSSEGFGIGLSIVKEIAHAHGGEVTVDSVPGLETRFSITLPR